MNGSVVLSYAPRTAVLRRGFRLRLSLRLDTVWHCADAAAGGPDLRSVGSGNIGATNVLRTGRKGLAAATLIGDMLKGTVAVLVAALLCSGTTVAMAAAVGRFPRPSVSGLAALSRRQGRGDLYWRAARTRLAGSACLLRRLARDRGAHPLLVACRPDRQRRNAGLSCGGAASVRGAALFVLLSIAVVGHAPRQHCAASGRDRRQNRRPVLGRRRFLKLPRHLQANGSGPK